MKKQVAIVLAGMSLGVLAPAAQAAEPVKISGDMTLSYKRIASDTSAAQSGGISTLRIKAEADLGSDWTLYTRLGAQHAGAAELGDFNTAHYGSAKKSVLAIDQFGLTHKSGEFTYKIGRQEAVVGTTALLYSRPDSNIGRKGFVDGVSAAGKSGILDLTALLAREDNAANTENNKLYVVRAGYSPRENLSWGMTLGRYTGSVEGSDETATHWAVDSTYKFGKNSVTGEFTKANRSSDSKAYAVTLKHDLDSKTAAYITGFKVENNAGMGGQSDFGRDVRGIHYGVNHTLQDNMALELVYKKEKAISSGVKNTEFEAAVSYSF